MASGGAAGVGDQPRFRYGARLANEIELRWQDRWEAAGTFGTPNPVGPLAAGFDQVAGRPKFMIMDMFPYPSGSGLHVGHPLGYIATDVYARYLCMTGHNVLHPFGYDAFGLPAVEDAVAAARYLAGPLRAGTVRLQEVRAVQRRRWPTTAAMQALQRVVHARVIEPVLAGRQVFGAGADAARPPGPVRIITAVPWLRRVPAYFLAYGALRERPPAASLR